ncbi:MAG: hypothetical protein D6743_13270 [Calditrichaeota bacterium]|nr:MAG: hypothetical protein D6743_13270 [Calditrichota bacterium]
MERRDVDETFPLRHTYFREMMRSLKKMKAALGAWQKRPEERTHPQAIAAAAREVADLAMIHGYEGVESIAEQLQQSLGRMNLSDDPERAGVFLKVESAIVAIRQIARIEDFLEGRLTVRRVAADRGDDVSSHTVKIGDEEAEPFCEIEKLTEADLNDLSAISSPEPQFDISEFESVAHLMAKARTPRAESPSSDSLPH